MIGIHEPKINKKTINEVNKCLRTNWISSSGIYVKKLSKLLSKYLKVKFVLPTNSGTSALDLAIRVTNPPVGSIIIAPAITFVAPINAILYNKCQPLFIDCDEHLNLDPKTLKKFFEEEVIKKKEKKKNYYFHKRSKKKIFGIIVTHVFGNAVNISEIKKICSKYKLKLIEDAAESIGTIYSKGSLKNKHSGTVGDIGCYSFNGNKIITGGSGGAFVTNKIKYFKRAKHLAFQSKKDSYKFFHDEVGYNYGINNICASIAYSQLKKIKISLAKKKIIRKNYANFFRNNSKFSILKSPKYSINNNWLNILVINNAKQKIIDGIYKKFFAKKIQIRPVWQPNYKNKHLSKFYKYGTKNSSEYRKFICLPSSEFLTKKQIIKICRLF